MKERLSYVPPVMAAIAVGAHEKYVMNLLRAENVNLPLPRGIQEAYYQNTGDLLDGIQQALVVDLCSLGLSAIACESLSDKNPLKKVARYIIEHPKARAVIAGAVSGAAVVLEELNGFYSAADVNDIPAGIIGAALYTGTRIYQKSNSKLRLETQVA